MEVTQFQTIQLITNFSILFLISTPYLKILINYLKHFIRKLIEKIICLCKSVYFKLKSLILTTYKNKYIRTNTEQYLGYATYDQTNLDLSSNYIWCADGSIILENDWNNLYVSHKTSLYSIQPENQWTQYPI